MSKGSKQRPIFNKKSFNEGWDRIFNKSEDKMQNEFLKEHEGQIRQEFNCYCTAINKIRHDFCLDSKVFTPNDYERFGYAFIQRRLK